MVRLDKELVGVMAGVLADLSKELSLVNVLVASMDKELGVASEDD